MVNTRRNDEGSQPVPILAEGSPFLGHILSAKGVVVDPSKVQEVLEWKSPTLVTESRSFLDLPGYYRRFTQDFSKVSKPMLENPKW